MDLNLWPAHKTAASMRDYITLINSEAHHARNSVPAFCTRNKKKRVKLIKAKEKNFVLQFCSLERNMFFFFFVFFTSSHLLWSNHNWCMKLTIKSYKFGRASFANFRQFIAMNYHLVLKILGRFAIGVRRCPFQ